MVSWPLVPRRSTLQGTRLWGKASTSRCPRRPLPCRMAVAMGAGFQKSFCLITIDAAMYRAGAKIHRGYARES